MKRLFRRFSRVAAADCSAAASPSASRLLRPKQESPSAARVPQGHVPVCVGEEGGPVERFAVRAELLGKPAFAALLLRAAQEYGYGHPGALRIPCSVSDFHRLLLRLSDGDADDDKPAAEC